ncbi:EPIDERMAL PATTERNING FACTOR-like protein 9 [Euphorbia peplus]|nr:EPIDERMAL PATTERNING FACTOR-like protein 9 [Euphorbia peplus]
MANIKLWNLLFFLLFLAAASVSQGSRTQLLLAPHPKYSLSHLQEAKEGKMSRNSRRLMIGSTAPICTYNECRGCKYKCRAEQVPVEGNDPINSSYHYKCVCHR